MGGSDSTNDTVGVDVAPRRSRLRLWTELAAAGVAAIVIFFFLLPPLMVSGLEGKDRYDAEHDIRSVAVQLFLGTAVFVGTYFTIRHNNAQRAIEREARYIEREGQITERFTRAVDQLSNANPIVRIGGIYGLERIARESRRDHPAIMDLLSTYVRVGAPRAAETTADSSPQPCPPSDIAAAMSVLGGRRREYDLASQAGRVWLLDLSRVDLSGLVLTYDRANFGLVDFTGSCLSKAMLYDGHFESANLTGADLRGANLTSAYLDEATLASADLTNAELGSAHLDGGDFRWTLLDDANLLSAFLVDAIFIESRLRGATLCFAHVEGANFESADLEGADLQGAFSDSTTRWPPHFRPEDHGIVEVSMAQRPVNPRRAPS
jgi:uncharacterized protein YjbI with pentapeptide repeats